MLDLGLKLGMDCGSSALPSRSFCSVRSRHGALAKHKPALASRVPLDRALAAGRPERANAGCSIGAPVVRIEPGAMGHDAAGDAPRPFLDDCTQAEHDASPTDKCWRDSSDDDDGGDQLDSLGCC